MTSPQQSVASKPSKLPNAVPLLVGLGVVVICLALGAGFIWWYLRGSLDSNTVNLSPADIASIRDTGQRLAYQANGGVPLNRGGGNGFVAPPPPPDPDGVFAAGPTQQNIRVGMVQVNVKIPPPGGTPTLVFRQRNYGMLAEPPTFTIARRIVHENTLAQQLAVTDDQIAKLKPIITQPAMAGKYVLALPVAPADAATVAKAWVAFNATIGGDKTAHDNARAALLLAARTVGDPAMDKAKAEYEQANQLISSILEARQIEAYKLGKSLAK
ncbi:MAG: hypothetical protein ABSH22_14535 [Tepidisphaeraceae bacterium]